MRDFLISTAIIFGVFGVSFILINLRHVVTGKEFRGTCSSNNPMLKDELGECSLCGKKADEACQMPDMPEVKAAS